MKILPITITSLFVVVQANGAASADSTKEDYATINTNDWLSQLACTVDVAGGHPSLVTDETICASTTDGTSGQSCLWCDATSTIGHGICISSDQKSMMSQYWDQLCNASQSTVEQQQQQLTEGDWLSHLACNVDISGQQPSLIDENTCSSTRDATGKSCVWCDASSTIGSEGGLCVSPDQKALLGQYWDQLCITSGSSSSNPPPPPPPPTPPPTPPPVPVPVPAPDNVPDELKCTMDASSNVIADEVTCIAQKDVNGGDCVWCEVPILGGTCITSEMKSAISFLCSSTSVASGYLRGETNNNNNDNGEEGWKTLDPTCLIGNANELVVDKDDCVSKADSNGNACIWCDAGNDVFGICATMEEKEYLGSYLNCDMEESTDNTEGVGLDFDALFAVE
jgi:hypothetical protein